MVKKGTCISLSRDTIVYSVNMGIKIISLNVRGLNDEIKRRSIFNYYRSRADILCIQETHCTQEWEKYWGNEWGGSFDLSRME